MTVTFRPAVREQIPLLLGLAGGTGSGKTYSALELARGIAGGKRFAVIDTENGRAKIYADRFQFDHAEIRAPFTPQTYVDAITAAEAAGYPVVVVDSASHEWYGDGGCLDRHDELMGGDQKKNMSAWIEPKRNHKKLVTRLLQMKAHVILCFRAEPKVEAVRKNGHLEIVPKASLTGLDGWIPIAEKNLPYELTASFLLMADKPGVPRPIKLPAPLEPLISLSDPLEAKTGLAFAEWALGSAGEPKATDDPDRASDEKPSPAVSSSAQKTELPGETFEDIFQGATVTETGDQKASVPTKDKLDELVNELCKADKLHVEHLYMAVSKMRGSDQTLALVGDDGELHWDRLRDTLTKDEASSLVGRLSRLQENVKAAK